MTLDRDQTPPPRCPRCSNYPQICGHDLPLSERLKTLHTDTSWMANAGSHGRSDGD